MIQSLKNVKVTHRKARKKKKTRGMVTRGNISKIICNVYGLNISIKRKKMTEEGEKSQLYYMYLIRNFKFNDIG